MLITVQSWIPFTLNRRNRIEKLSLELKKKNKNKKNMNWNYNTHMMQGHKPSHKNKTHPRCFAACKSHEIQPPSLSHHPYLRSSEENWVFLCFVDDSNLVYESWATFVILFLGICLTLFPSYLIAGQSCTAAATHNTDIKSRLHLLLVGWSCHETTFPQKTVLTFMRYHN